MFVMGEVAQRVFQESPTAFLNEMRGCKHARVFSDDDDVLATIAELGLPVEVASSPGQASPMHWQKHHTRNTTCNCGLMKMGSQWKRMGAWVRVMLNRWLAGQWIDPGAWSVHPVMMSGHHAAPCGFCGSTFAGSSKAGPGAAFSAGTAENLLPGALKAFCRCARAFAERH